METKIFILSSHKLFPIMDEISIMCKAIGLPVGNATIQVLFLQITLKHLS